MATTPIQQPAHTILFENATKLHTQVINIDKELDKHAKANTLEAEILYTSFEKLNVIKLEVENLLTKAIDSKAIDLSSLARNILTSKTNTTQTKIKELKETIITVFNDSLSEKVEALRNSINKSISNMGNLNEIIKALNINEDEANDYASIKGLLEDLIESDVVAKQIAGERVKEIDSTLKNLKTDILNKKSHLLNDLGNPNLLKCQLKAEIIDNLFCLGTLAAHFLLVGLKKESFTELEEIIQQINQKEKDSCPSSFSSSELLQDPSFSTLLAVSTADTFDHNSLNKQKKTRSEIQNLLETLAILKRFSLVPVIGALLISSDAIYSLTLYHTEESSEERIALFNPRGSSVSKKGTTAHITSFTSIADAAIFFGEHFSSPGGIEMIPLCLNIDANKRSSLKGRRSLRRSVSFSDSLNTLLNPPAKNSDNPSNTEDTSLDNPTDTEGTSLVASPPIVPSSIVKALTPEDYRLMAKNAIQSIPITSTPISIKRETPLLSSPLYTLLQLLGTKEEQSSSLTDEVLSLKLANLPYPVKRSDRGLQTVADLIFSHLAILHDKESHNRNYGEAAFLNKGGFSSHFSEQKLCLERVFLELALAGLEKAIIDNNQTATEDLLDLLEPFTLSQENLLDTSSSVTDYLFEQLSAANGKDQAPDIARERGRNDFRAGGSSITNPQFKLAAIRYVDQKFKQNWRI